MIPLKIETLLEGRVVEHDRVEYKTGWNPNDIIHSICAFANDYDNTNGGYIVIGVEEDHTAATSFSGVTITFSLAVVPGLRLSVV